MLHDLINGQGLDRWRGVGLERGMLAYSSEGGAMVLALALGFCHDRRRRRCWVRRLAAGASRGRAMAVSGMRRVTSRA